MSKQAADSHKKAAEHHEKAAQHHKEASKHHEEINMKRRRIMRTWPMGMPSRRHNMEQTPRSPMLNIMEIKNK